MSTGSAPDSPDYNDAAQRTADSGRANIHTSQGNFDWSRGADGRDTLNVSLSPQLQAAMDAQQGIQSQRSQLAMGLLGQIGQDVNNPVSYDQARSYGEQGAEAMYGQLASRLDPQWEARETKFKSDALNQGLSYGDEGYQDQAAMMGRDRNDAYLSANRAATMGGLQYAAGDLGLQQQGRTANLNILNALLSGQQVQGPQQYATGQGADFLGAARAEGDYNMRQYEANQATQGAMYGALGQLGGTAGGMALGKWG
jgi:hypothetical protein